MEKKYVIYKLFSQKSAPLITIETQKSQTDSHRRHLKQSSTRGSSIGHGMPPPSIPVRLSVLYPRSRQPIGLYVSLFGSVCGSCYYSMWCSDTCRKCTVDEVYRCLYASYLPSALPSYNLTVSLE